MRCRLAVPLAAVVSFLTLVSTAQERQSLIKGEVDAAFTWSLGSRTMAMKGQRGTSLDLSAGVRLGNSYIVELAVASNLSHTNLNHGYFGLALTYVLDQSKLMHWSAQLLLATAGMKEYRRPKTGLMDDFGNVFGASYAIAEPGLSAEVNVTTSMTLVTGFSYRIATDINRHDVNVAILQPTRADVSGFVWHLAVRHR
jgi:hypothetical protein